MIYDCVSFFNELELLEIRLRELDPVVDFFVISEATQTHQGNPKPLNFKANEHMLNPWLHKIRYFAVEFPSDFEAQCRAGLYAGDIQVHKPTGLDMNWARERYQRDAVMRGLTDCKDDDVVTICDLDEIPTAASLRLHERHHGIRTLNMLSFYYYMNHKVGDWNGPAKILPYDLLAKTTPSNIRNMEVPALEGSTGWHYAWLGGAERVTTKLKSFAHAEYNSANTNVAAIEHMLNTRGEGDYSYNDEFPEYVKQNISKYKAMGFIKERSAVTPKRPEPKIVVPPISGPYRPAC